MSIPLAIALVAKVCLKSWNLTLLHPILSSNLYRILVTEHGCLGFSLSSGEGNTHSENTFLLYSLKTPATFGGMIIVLDDDLVFGVHIDIFPSTTAACREMFISPVCKSMSSHFKPHISPLRIPVAASNRKSS